MAECIAPGTVSDEALAAYVLNPQEAEDFIAQHIAACAACQSEVASIRALLPVMGRRLRLVDCPPVEQLDAYLAGELSKAEVKTLALHLKQCLRCQQEVAEMRQALRPAAPPPSSRPERLPLFATLLSSSPAARLAWRVRGAGEDHEPLTYTAGHLTLVLVPIFDEQGQVKLIGRFEGQTSEAPPPPAVRLFSLADAAAPTASPAAEALIDEHGEFILGPVPRGSYQIEVLLPDRIFVVGSALVLEPPRED